MNKKYGIRIILIIMIIVNCLVIFKFSAQGAEMSNGSSGKVVNKIVEILPQAKNLSDNEKEELKEKITTPVRKMAHFSIYTCLGLLAYLCSKTFEGTEKKRLIGSWGFGTLYACTDEFHQLFVEGRSGEIKDVIIDSTGVLFGILIAHIIIKIINKLKSN